MPAARSTATNICRRGRTSSDRAKGKICGAARAPKQRCDDDFTVKVTPDGSNYFTDNYIAVNTWTKVQFNNADSSDQNAFNGSNNNFKAPFAGNYTLGFSLRFKANATRPDEGCRHVLQERR